MESQSLDWGFAVTALAWVLATPALGFVVYLGFLKGLSRRKRRGRRRRIGRYLRQERP